MEINGFNIYDCTASRFIFAFLRYTIFYLLSFFLFWLSCKVYWLTLNVLSFFLFTSMKEVFYEFFLYRRHTIIASRCHFSGISGTVFECELHYAGWLAGQKVVGVKKFLYEYNSRLSWNWVLIIRMKWHFNIDNLDIYDQMQIRITVLMYIAASTGTHMHFNDIRSAASLSL